MTNCDYLHDIQLNYIDTKTTLFNFLHPYNVVLQEDQSEQSICNTRASYGETIVRSRY